MAKPGDAVEFRSGTWGLAAPRNLGILLARYRQKGTPWVRVMTLEGVKEGKAEHLTRRTFRQGYEGPLADLEAVSARLRMLASHHAEGALAEEGEDDLGRLESELWEASCHDARPWGEEELARRLCGEPSPLQLRQAREALSRCRRAGTGHFQTAGRGDLWRPWSRAEMEAMQKAWRGLEGLRGRLVRAGQDEAGERTFTAVGLDEAQLSDADHATLGWVRAAMAQFVEHDGVPQDGTPVAGIGGLGAVQVAGMDLHRRLGFLAQDWIRAEHTTGSSDYVVFLLQAGLWSPDDAVEALVRRHVNQEEFFEHTPDAEAEAAADRLQEPQGLEEGRTDLRHLACWTIDPPDAKDFDDAVGIEDLGQGRMRLWVHVADVSHYVPLDSRLDRHARKRATSVYLPGRVLPMLPKRISDHLCSLRDDGDRHALSVGLDVDAAGRITAAQFHAALIRVTRNISYGKALELRQRGEPPFPALFELAQRMRSQRRGLELETGELKVLLGESGFSALEKRADDATRMIETFMVAANEAVALQMDQARVPVLLRCHPLPDPQKAERFAQQAKTMGFDLDLQLPRRPPPQASAPQTMLDRLKAGGGKLNLFGGGISLQSDDGDAPSSDPAPASPAAGQAAARAGPKTSAKEPDDAPSQPALPGFTQLEPAEREAWLRPFRAVVDALAAHADRELAEVATVKLLGAMGRAYYSPVNEGHFGLASTHYAHFTSPIRRYPDLVVHRNLKWLIQGAQGEPPHAHASLAAMCDHCSNQEKAADQLERRIKASCLVLATLGVGEGESGSPARVTGITPTSLFLVRPDGIEARAWVRDLPGGPYHVDEWESMLLQEARQEDLAGPGARASAWLDPETGEAQRVRARLGDQVHARLAARDVAAGRTEARVTQWHG